MYDCLYNDDEIRPEAEGEAPEGAVVVDGILNPFALHPQRLESHRAEVGQMLLGLPHEFMQSGGGGWSFLNACQDRNDVQWTGLHRTMDFLFVLGVGLGYAAYLLPREMWSAFPGGMPYVVVKDAEIAQSDRIAPDE